MGDVNDSIKTLVLEHLQQPSVITFGDELNLSVILDENNSNDPADNEDITFPVRNRSIKETKLRDLTCSVCQKVFPSKRYLNRHFSKHTSRFKCPLCGKVLCRKETLLKHIPRCKENELSIFLVPKKSHVPQKSYVPQKDITKYSCDRCSKSFTRRENYDQHVMTHYGMQVVCFVCDKVLKSLKSYRRHIMSHQTEKPQLTCALCPAKFSLPSNLRRHELHQHQHLNEIICEKCKHKVKNEKILQKHLGNETMKCTICFELFCLGTDLKNHLKLIHGGFWFSCKLCFGVTPFMTKYEYSLKEHVKKIHSIILDVDACYKDGWYLYFTD